ncbi:DNA cytosine methyltransferase [Arthrobacter sp. Sr24]
MKFVDLFSGCGGLSLGIERSGFELVAAVEKSDMAARTYYHNYIANAKSAAVWDNHLNLSLSQQAERRVITHELAQVLENDGVMESFTTRGIDVVVGGPPCQGFSMAGRRQKDDIRNRLAWEYLKFVERVKPRAVVIENVVGMSRSFVPGEESSFSQLQQALAKIGPKYVVQAVHVNAMHYGAPQHRPRLMLIALRKDVADDLKVKASTTIWKSGFIDELDQSQIPHLAPSPTVNSNSVFTIRDAISDLKDWGGSSSGKNTTYIKNLSISESVVNNGAQRTGQKEMNQTPRAHSDRVVTRFSFYRMLLEKNMDQRLFATMASDPANARQVAKEWLKDVVVPVTLEVSHRPKKLKEFASLDDLIELAVSIATKKHSQKALSADLPARTVVTLPDDYVHPNASRIFTVRELARIQGFPDNFEFVGKETTGASRRKFEVPQYTQVGNAVSPWQSIAVGKLLKSWLAKHDAFIGAIRD